MLRRWILALLLMTAAQASTSLRGEDRGPDGIPGTLILVGGGGAPGEVTELIKQAAGDEPVFVLSEASENPEEAATEGAEWLREHGISNVTSVPSGLSPADRVAQTLSSIRSAKGVWISGGQQSRLADCFNDQPIETALNDVLNRGGIVAGNSAGAAIMSRVMIASGRDEPEIKTGWDLLPGSIVDQHFTQRNRQGRLEIAVEKHPHVFGLGVDEQTAVVVNGRRMIVIGEGSATVILAAATYRKAETIKVASGSAADLTQLHRSAVQRASNVDPGVPTMGTPRVDQGSLVIVGGGGMPKDVVEKFMELAGGEKARIVVLPTAVPREETSTEVPGFLRGPKFDQITVLPQRREEVNSEEFQTALKEATGIWFGGGRQWNFVDSYEGTNAIELFRDVLRRGGVIGGSSAGATIQGEFLVRGHPLGNTVMMAEGYERGFGFLPGTAIDQHFTQRGRHPDLIPVIQRHPKLLGIGIDESTAIVVTGTKVEVLGQHAAHFLTSKSLESIPANTPLPAEPGDAVNLYRTIESGKTLDLAEFMK